MATQYPAMHTIFIFIQSCGLFNHKVTYYIPLSEENCFDGPLYTPLPRMYRMYVGRKDQGPLKWKFPIKVTPPPLSPLYPYLTLLPNKDFN